MKRLFVFLAAAAASLLTWSCQKAEDSTPSLSADPKSLTFDANGAAPQIVTVNANNVEWDYNLNADAAKWVTVTKEGASLEVSVTDNPYAKERRASITLVSKTTGVKNVSVPITQKASDTPVDFQLNIEPRVVQFPAEGDTKEVTITPVGEGLTYEVAPVDSEYADWLSYTQTETGLSITVKPSKDTNMRTGTITITASEPSIGDDGQVNIAIQQDAYVAPPSLTYTITPGDGQVDGDTITLPFNYQGMNQKIVAITVNAVNCEWEVSVDNTWLIVNQAQIEGEELVNLNLSSETFNTTGEDQTATITITTDAEGVGPFEITVVRKSGTAGQSTITENTTMGTITSTNVSVKDNETYARWTLELFTGDVKPNVILGYDGIGERLHIFFNSAPVTIEADGSAKLPEGTYTVTAEAATEHTVNTIEQGSPNVFNIANFPVGTWYVKQSGKGQVDSKALITEGTMEVTDNGDGTYKLDVKFTCDNSYEVNATYNGALTF